MNEDWSWRIKSYKLGNWMFLDLMGKWGKLYYLSLSHLGWGRIYSEYMRVARPLNILSHCIYPVSSPGFVGMGFLRGLWEFIESIPWMSIIKILIHNLITLLYIFCSFENFDKSFSNKKLMSLAVSLFSFRLSSFFLFLCL